MKLFKRFSCYCVLAAFLFAGCDDDEAGPQDEGNNDDQNDEQLYENGLFVINEGNFQWGEGSVSFIDFADYSISNNIFNKANGRVPGNVANSFSIFNDSGYLVVNNSQIIEVVDPSTFESTGAIEGFNSPRHFKGVRENKAYVSDLYENAVYVVDPEENEITGQINIDGWTEEMVLFDDKLFVGNMDNGSIVEISVTSDAVTGEIEVLAEPASLVKDDQGNFWVLCTGGFEETHPGLFKINPEKGDVEKAFTFSEKEDSPSGLTYSASQQVFYYNNGNRIFKFDPEGELPGELFLDLQGEFNVHSLQYIEQSGHLILTDAKDYTSEGTVYKYDPATGERLESWEAGVIPGYIEFYGE